MGLEFIAAAFLATVGDPAAQAADALPPVIVTAQKREQALQDVPAAVAVVSGEALEARNIQEISQLQTAAPGLTFIGLNSPRGSGLSIRGISTTSFSEGVEGSVGIVVDGVPIGRQGAGFTDFSDLERIEVLRGPQGTLFGKNASAGVVHFVTRAPTRTFEAGGSVSAGSQGTQRASGYVSGPLSVNMGDRLRGRLSAYIDRRDGDIEDVAQGRLYNGRDEAGVRGKLAFDVSADTTVLLTADYTDRDAACCQWTTRSYGDPLGPVARYQVAAGINAGPLNRQVALEGEVYARQRTRGLSAEVTSRLANGLTLTSITAARAWDEADNGDLDQTPINLMNRNEGVLAQEQVSQELRLASPQDGPLSWVGGVFLYRQSILNQSDREGSVSEAAAAFGLVGATSQRLTVDTTSAAVFGDGSWRLGARFRLVAGARWTSERMETDFNRVTPATAAFPLLADYAATGRRRDEAWSWRVGTQYDLAPNAMAYATVSRGFKAGGFNVILDMTALRGVEPEIPTSYEVGFKRLSADRRLAVNVAAWHADIENYQAQTLVTTPTSIGFDLQNVGEVRTRGLEADAVWRPTHGLTASLAGSWIDARYRDYPNAQCYSGQAVTGTGCVAVAPFVYVQDLTGKRLPEPRATVNGGLRYERGRGFVEVGAAWRDASLTSPYQDPESRQEAFTLVDASAGVALGQGAQVSVWARNLFDVAYAEAIFETPFDFGTPVTPAGRSQFTPLDASRTVGVTLSWKRQ